MDDRIVVISSKVYKREGTKRITGIGSSSFDMALTAPRIKMN